LGTTQSFHYQIIEASHSTFLSAPGFGGILGIWSSHYQIIESSHSAFLSAPGLGGILCNFKIEFM
jgi:hypothetical protein